MAGNKIGGAKAAATNKRKYGADYYAKIGAKGGKLGRTGGFYANRELAREAGRKGGTNSKRKPSAKPSSKEFAELFQTVDNTKPLFEAPKKWYERLF